MRSRVGRSRELAMRPKSLLISEHELGRPAAGSTLHKADDFSAARLQLSICGKSTGFQESDTDGGSPAVLMRPTFADNQAL